MNAVCVIDTSLPPYAAPLARECVATVLVPDSPAQDDALAYVVAGGLLGVGCAMLAYGLWRAVRLMVGP